TLSVLSREDAKKIIEKFLEKKHFEITDQQQNEYITNLIQHTSGNPGWMCIGMYLALNNIVNNPPKKTISNINDIAQGYIDEFIHEMNEYCSKDSLEKIFFYLALFRRANCNDKKIREFLRKETKLEDTCDIIGILQELTLRKFLINFGYKKRFYAIKPDVIRDSILKTQLLSSTEPIRLTYLAEKTIKDLLDDKTPLFDEVVSSLARIDVQNSTDLLTKRIFDAIKKMLNCEPKTTRMLYKAIENLKKIQFANIQLAVDIYDDILKTPSVVEDKFLNYLDIDHKCLNQKIVWQLFCLAETLQGEKCQEVTNKIFNIFCYIYIDEKSVGNLPNDGNKNAKNLISRILRQETNLQPFSQCAVDKLNILFKDIKTLNKNELSLFKCIANSLLSIEREGNYFGYNVFYITRYTLSQENPLLKSGQKIFENIKKAVNSRLPIELKKILIEIIGHVYHDWNRVKIQGSSSEQEDSKITYWKIKQLKWVKETILTFSECERILKNAIREIWKWDLTNSKSELQTIAQECEAIFSQDKILFLIQNLCDRDQYKKWDDFTEQLVKLFASKLNELVSIIKDTQKERDPIPLHSIALFVAKKYFIISEFPKQTLSLLASNNECERRFGIFIATNVLNLLRNAKDQRYEECWFNIVNHLQPENKYEIFCALYSDGRPFMETPFTDFDWLQLVQNEASFSKKNHLFSCVAPLGFLNWIRAIEFLENQWDAIDNRQEHQSCLYHFKQSLSSYYWSKVNNDSTSNIDLLPISFIFKHVGELIDPTSIFDFNFEYLIKKCTPQPFSWFINFLKKRMEIEQEISRKEFPEFNILPYDFSPKKWTDYSSATPSEQNEFLSICEKRTSINFNLPKLIFDLDPSGTQNDSLIRKILYKHTQKNDFNLVLSWVELISWYPVDTNIWRECAKIVCTYARTQSNSSDRNQIFNSLVPNETEIPSCPQGEIPPIYFEKLHFAQNKYNQETDKILKDYWKYLIKFTEAKIEWKKGVIEEEKQ
ncbi:MAG: hypothetical protein WCS73_08210, partial [Lentisphaeria bacterium]